ncbi:unnamed protein product [Allacma fusca]|uniref:Uncharacterized protein n=1 Tax=Allacma fusca TaxID=39272 RepID=A0A8J2KGP3_9HEXA|nr:unnamed protein product [Allacma fusca]
MKYLDTCCEECARFVQQKQASSDAVVVLRSRRIQFLFSCLLPSSFSTENESLCLVKSDLFSTRFITLK